MAAKGVMSLISLILVAGALLFMFFIIFAGAIDSAPVNRWYLLQADTSNIPGAPQISRWTYWNGCTVRADDTNQCGPVRPAFPLDPPSSWNFDTTVNIPSDFIGTSKFFLLTRFMFAFMLIALFFGACAFLFGVFALCTKLGSYLAGIFCFVAFLFQGLQCALMTSAYIMGRDAFNSNNQTAMIGTYAFAFEWAACGMFFICGVIYCCTGGRNKDPAPAGSRQGSFFKGRSKSTRSQGSFRTKEYA